MLRLWQALGKGLCIHYFILILIRTQWRICYHYFYFMGRKLSREKLRNMTQLVGAGARIWTRSNILSNSHLLPIELPLPYRGCMCVCVCVCVCVHAQSCPTLCDPMDCSLFGFSVYGIFQARILERVAISFTRGSSSPRDWTHVSCVSCIGRQVLYQLNPQGSHRGCIWFHYENTLKL